MLDSNAVQSDLTSVNSTFQLEPSPCRPYRRFVKAAAQVSEKSIIWTGMIIALVLGGLYHVHDAGSGSKR